jgi:hypothetical protein
LQNKLSHWPQPYPSQNLFQLASYKYYKVEHLILQCIFNWFLFLSLYSIIILVSS